jgi:hypothetical protein
MLTKFVTDHSISIRQVEVRRETEASVFVADKSPRSLERRIAKSSEFHRYHGTWEAAHAYLLGRAQAQLDLAIDRLAAAQGAFGNVKGMRNSDLTPTEPTKAPA